MTNAPTREFVSAAEVSQGELYNNNSSIEAEEGELCCITSFLEGTAAPSSL
jgi:hypothetical protein